jgi:chorismate-pyruvate lyase
VTIQATNEFLVEKSDRFDPLKDLFVAQSVKPSQLGEINLRALGPFQRALLMIDGTVTKFIEAYRLEPVEIIRLRQMTQLLPTDHLWLGASKGTAIIAREVILRSKYSHTVFAYATSLIVPERIPDTARQDLELNDKGLGHMLLNSRMETYRELLWYGKEHTKGLPESICQLINSELLSRTYRIIACGQPLMLINEKFPFDDDRLPSHH